MKSYLFFIIVIFIFVSCKNQLITESELKEYVLQEAHQLRQQQQRAGIDLSVSYRPTDLLIAQELRAKQNYADTTVQQLRTKYGNYAYFILNLSKGNQEVLRQGNNFSSFSSILQTLSFDMAHQVNLTTSNNDTIPVADFIYPRLYGASH